MPEQISHTSDEEFARRLAERRAGIKHKSPNRFNCLRPLIGAIIGGGIACLLFWPPQISHESGSDMTNGLSSLGSLFFIAFGIFIGCLLGIVTNRFRRHI
jgi:hypothetical protein